MAKSTSKKSKTVPKSQKRNQPTKKTDSAKKTAATRKKAKRRSRHSASSKVKKKGRRTTAARPKKKPARWFRCGTCRRFFPVAKRDSHLCIEPSETLVFSETEGELWDAWEELRRFAAELGEQRVYASQKAVMFARRVCYLFVRPKRTYLEVCFFLRRKETDPIIHKTISNSKTRTCHTVRLLHRDQLEAPLTQWIEEAFETCS